MKIEELGTHEHIVVWPPFVWGEVKFLFWECEISTESLWQDAIGFPAEIALHQSLRDSESVFGGDVGRWASRRGDDLLQLLLLLLLDDDLLELKLPPRTKLCRCPHPASLAPPPSWDVKSKLCSTFGDLLSHFKLSHCLKYRWYRCHLWGGIGGIGIDILLEVGNTQAHTLGNSVPWLCILNPPPALQCLDTSFTHSQISLLQ